MTADRPHGPLPLFLVCLTVVTGLVDAFSYLRLGHVFVANMTGNVVFLGFGLAGVGEISIVASLLAVLAFVSARPWEDGGPQAEQCTAVTYWLPPRRFRRASFWSRPSSQAPAVYEVRLFDWY